MATSLSALAHFKVEADLAPDAPYSGSVKEVLENVTGGRRFTQGTGSGQADRLYVRRRTGLGAGGTDNYNLLAAGSLEDVYNQAIDADELKVLAIVPTSGSIRIDAPVANFIGIFNDASDVLNVPASGMFLDFGAAGLTVSTNGSFDITETTGAATADYDLICIVAQ